ncbi:MAG: hypothetical protein H7X89_06330 [Rhizobiales bacterium]|nr:hypothetical protein [Hyphomicrobiales bacterium]
MSTTNQPTSFLRYALIGDALASGATGLLMAAGAGLLSGILGLPQMLLQSAGLVLLPYAALVVFIGTRPIIMRAAVWMVIVANLLWSAESILLLMSSWVFPAGLGYAFVIFQAAVVFAFAVLQFIGLRRHKNAMTATA